MAMKRTNTPLMSGRFLGGHYDSVKQQIVFSNKLALWENNEAAREEFYNSFKLRLMLDMVFSKTVVFPYAQVLDGHFFHLLACNYYEDNFFPALKNDVINWRSGIDPIIEIRVNPSFASLQNTAQGLLSNANFCFSSLNSISPNLSQQYNDFINKLRIQNYTREISTGNSDFIERLTDSFDSADVEKIRHWLDSMEFIYNSIEQRAYVQPWQGSISSHIISARQIYNNRYNTILKEIEALKNDCHSSEQILLIDQVLEEFSSSNIILNRSDFVDRMESCSFDQELKKKILAAYNELMFKAMAIQHNCGLWDEGVSAGLESKSDSIVSSLSTSVKENLIKMTWPDFFRWLRDQQDIRSTLWDSESVDFKETVKNVSNALLKDFNSEIDNKFIYNGLKRIAGRQIATAIFQVALSYIMGNSPDIIQIALTQISQIIISNWHDTKQISNILNSIKDFRRLYRLCNCGLYGGGSNPIIYNSNGLAFAKEANRNISDDAGFMASIHVENRISNPSTEEQRNTDDITGDKSDSGKELSFGSIYVGDIK